MRCDKCDGATQEKQIRSKKNGKEYTVLECLNGCRNGKFAYSFFPPKNGNGNGHVKVENQPSSNQAVALLAQILNSLHRIEKALGSKSSPAQLDTDQDMEAPF